jgi:orotate phosphoribosyltransferase
MTDVESQLLNLLRERSFQRGTFTLASGAESNYYIDGKMSEVFSKGAFLIGRVLYEATKDLTIDAIGGLEVGAVPLTTAATLHYHLNNRPMEGFWVRDQAKLHGTRKKIEGAALARGARVVVVDDVLTTGGSALKAASAVKEAGCDVIQAIALVDRLQGARELLEQHGIEFRSIFTIRDFGIDVPDRTSPRM